jgi:cell division protein FtsQ
MSDAAYSDIPFTVFDDLSRKKPWEGAEKPEKKVRDKKVVILKVVVVILAILVLAEVVLYTVIIPTLGTVKIQFKGLKNISVSQVTEKVNEVGASTWIQFDAAKAVAVFSSISEVERVSVDKHFPDRVVVEIKEREAVAKTIVTIDGRVVPVQIDKNGVLFTSETNSVIMDSNVPLISGLPIENVQNGMRLPAKYRMLMEQISKIRALPQHYFAAISEIQVVPKEYGNYELILYPIHSKVKVLADQNLNEETLKYMIVSLDVVNSIEPDVYEIDIRYGATSYHRR